VKTNKDFKLSKSTKRTLATLTSGVRGHWKSMMIEAEVLEKRAKLAKLNRNEKGEA
jgi:hypothetical protein